MIKRNRFKKAKTDNTIERDIITGMIVSTEFMRKISLIYKPDYISASFCKTVAHWCISYYSRYKEAPQQEIQSIFEENEAKIDEDTSTLIKAFLSDISSEYERSDKFNVDRLYDKAVQEFKLRNIKDFKNNIAHELINGDINSAEEVISKYNNISSDLCEGVNPFADKIAIRESFERASKPLFHFSGALGDLMNDLLVRDSLIGFMAKEKGGKTFMLAECAFRAIKERCNVALFEAGDMSQSQIIRRLQIRLAGKSDKKKYCQTMLIPVLDCAYNQNNTCTEKCRVCRVGLEKDADFDDAPEDYKPCSVCSKRRKDRFKGAVWYREREEVEPLTWREACRLSDKFNRRLRGKQLKVVSKPNSTLTVRAIETQLDLWEQTESFVPDVVIIDYADILAPEHRISEHRHQQNESWKAMRSLSQKKHNLIITATQADAASYGKKWLSLQNFSEDKRKYAHVTGMFALNQYEQDQEKERGIVRISALLAREEEVDSKSYVTVLQSLPAGRPVIASFS